MTEKEFKELNGEEYVMWSSPDQARSVVEIGREELIELERLSWQVTNFVNSFL